MFCAYDFLFHPAKLTDGLHLRTLMIYILHIDTSADRGVIALSREGKVLREKINSEAKNQAATINLLIEEVLKDAAITLNEIAAFSVIGGPGSYTGLRIGLATAKAFCYTLDKPLLLQNKLTVLALQAYHSAPHNYEKYAAILPARAKEYFFCLIDNKGQLAVQPKHIFENELEELIGDYSGSLLISGVKEKMFASSAQVVYTNSEVIDSQFWAAYSLTQFNEEEFTILATAEPYYLKEVYTHK
jgi:tRNA threonylcarbamoyladenosine biosynthesis protein TsaB